MKRIIIILLFPAMLLCGCAAAFEGANAPSTTITTTAASPTTTAMPTTVTTAPKQLSDMTDYELLRKLAESKACFMWKADSNFDMVFSINGLFYWSPEFTELMTRSSALDSIKKHIDALRDEFPGSGLIVLVDHYAEIEEYLSKNTD